MRFLIILGSAWLHIINHRRIFENPSFDEENKHVRLKVLDEKDIFKYGFITEVNYLSLLAKMILVRKASNKWHMCVDHTDLNVACPKDPYPFPKIDHLIDGSSGYKTLSFMDAYLEYNQIKVNPIDATKKAFMSDHGNYYYNFTPFGHKNDGTAYQRLVYTVVSKKIGHKLELYLDDMIMKTSE